MKALISIASLFMIVLAGGCLGSSGSSNAPTLAFVYVVGSGANSIQALTEKSTGDLVVQPVTSFPTNPRPVSLALHPSKNFLYVANFTAATVSGFNVDHVAGILTPVGTATPPTPVCATAGACANPISLAINSGGQFLVVLNQGQLVPAPGTNIPATISVFGIDATRGLLTPVAGSPFSFPSLAPGGPQAMVMSSTAGVFFVSNGGAGTISAFSLGSGGTVTEIAGSPFTAGSDIVGLAIDPKGQFLYAADFTSSTISSFTIQSSGALAPVAGSPFPTHTGPFALAVDANGAFLFSGEQGAAGVSSFTTTGGVLKPVAGSPFVLVPSGSPQPAFLTVDPSNTFLYVGNSGTNSISGYTIKPDGSLAPLTNSPFVQAVGPQWIAITQ
ncbi:MAG TPA: beta-propeller fold lactonase family protein [Candidatus Angelobacter sp.]|nr:beta-propeller fold lactonase family protein [Candidatus Angelobacter sp.]